ncbi:signal transduction histidine kinase [Aurantimicrobium minutum]|uniref:hypothetical protein n=1 Tax=Aurantimicrobium minutum TaxID=708131 RepID=UPI002406FC38|nr:hypothetical protein [Aurantimicrobium minutum]MDF9809858.1 signal transduction histidine kinase [Aurantimicrobium minutum]
MIDFWRGLGRTEAINWISVVLLLFIQLNGSLLANYELNLEGRFLFFWLANALPFLPMSLVLLIGRYMINPRLPEKIRPASTLLIFELAIVVRLFSFDALLQGFGITNGSQFWARFGSAQANQMIILVVIGYLVASAKDYASQNAELAHLLSTTTSTQQDVQARLARRHQSLIHSIESQLHDALSHVTGDNSAHDAKHLKHVIDSVVRPLSHHLGRGSSPVAKTLGDVPTTSINIGELITRAFTDNPFYPVLSMLWMFLPLWTTLNSYQMANAFVVACLFSGVILITLFIAGLFWRFLTHRLRLGLRILSFILVPLVLAGCGGVLFYLIVGFHSIDKIAMLFFYFLVILTTVTLVGTSRRMLREINAELRQANVEMKRQLVTENAEARHFEEAVSRILHGPVQDAIWASVLRIELLPAGSKLSTADLDQVRQPITDALQLLREPEALTQNIEESVRELIELWSGAVSIKLDIEPELLISIAQSEKTNSALSELLREAISNAIRHGDATEVSVLLKRSPDSKDIELHVSNNGEPVSGNSLPGIGTQLLNDLTLSWTRQNLGGMVVLDAVIPLDRTH